ncbi:MAG: phosphoribosyl-AMP cyclohydrolase [Bacteroidota bacterium]
MFTRSTLLVAALALFATGCATDTANADSTSDDATTTDTAEASANPITAADVEAAQQAWGEGIVAIGQVFSEEGDFSARAQEHIATHYAYGDETVLFKPTLAAEDQFRGDPDEALSYFVGTEGTEDGGFAIAPYTDVRWENEGTVIDEDGDMAVAMGNYFFTGTDGSETKVEYSFGYVRGEDGNLKIALHHSSLPFSAQ